MVHIVFFTYKPSDRDNLEMAAVALSTKEFPTHQEVEKTLRSIDHKLLNQGFSPDVTIELIRFRVLLWGDKIPRDSDKASLNLLLPSIITTLGMNGIISTPPLLEEWPLAVKVAQEVVRDYPLPDDALPNNIY